MKRIAVTYENGEVFQHFGHTEEFKVYEVEDGKIIEQGTHDELMRLNGFYSELYNSQFAVE